MMTFPEVGDPDITGGCISVEIGLIAKTRVPSRRPKLSSSRWRSFGFWTFKDVTDAGIGDNAEIIVNLRFNMPRMNEANHLSSPLYQLRSVIHHIDLKYFAHHPEVHLSLMYSLQ